MNDENQQLEQQQALQIDSYLRNLKQKQKLDHLHAKFHEPCEYESISISQQDSAKLSPLQDFSQNVDNFKISYSNKESYCRPNFFKVQKIINQAIRSFIEEVLIRRLSQLTKRKLFFINDNSVQIDEFPLSNYQKVYQRAATRQGKPKGQQFLKSKTLLFDNEQLPTTEDEDESLIKCNQLTKFIECILNYIPLFYPNSAFLIFWNIVNAMVKISLVFMYSFHQFFHMTLFTCTQQTSYQLIYFLILLLLIFDLFINFNKIQIKHGIFITEKLRIAQNYLTTGFISDFLAIIPLFVTLVNTQMQCEEVNQSKVIVFDFSFFVNFFIYLMISNYYDSLNEIEQQLSPTPLKRMIIKLNRLILFLILLAHLTGCVLKFVGDLSVERFGYEDNWLSYKEIDQSLWIEQYIYSFYWASTTMITVGYGDLVPRNPLEIITLTLVMFLGCGVFGFMINQIGSIASDINQQSMDFKNEVEVLTRYLHQKKISNDLIQRAIANLEQIHKMKNKDRLSIQQEIMSKLSPQIKQDINYYHNQKVFQKFSSFFQDYSSQSIEKIMQKIEEQITTPGEIIYSSNKHQTENFLYYLDQGTVEFYAEPKNIQKSLKHQALMSNSIINEDLSMRTINQEECQKIKNVKSPNIFGNFGFFTGLDNKFLVISQGFCTLYKISRSDFLEIIRQNSQDLQRFMEVQDEIILNQKYEKLNLECFACQKVTNHLIIDCPFIHCQYNKHKVITRQMNRKNKRNEVTFTRPKSEKTKGTLKDLYETQKVVQAFLDKLRSDLQSDANESFKMSINTERERFSIKDVKSEIAQDENSPSKMTPVPELENLESEDYTQHKGESSNLIVDDQKQKAQRSKKKEPSLIKMTFFNEHERDSVRDRDKDKDHSKLKSSVVTRTEKKKQSYQVQDEVESQNENKVFGTQFNLNMDIMQEYSFYFPYFNISNVVKILSKYQRKHKSRKKSFNKERSRIHRVYNIQSEFLSIKNKQKQEIRNGSQSFQQDSIRKLNI